MGGEGVVVVMAFSIVNCFCTEQKIFVFCFLVASWSSRTPIDSGIIFTVEGFWVCKVQVVVCDCWPIKSETSFVVWDLVMAASNWKLPQLQLLVGRQQWCQKCLLRSRCWHWSGTRDWYLCSEEKFLSKSLRCHRFRLCR